MPRSSSGNPAQGWGWSYVIPRTPQPQKAADPEPGRRPIRAHRGSASANGLREGLGSGFHMVRGVAGKRANVAGGIAASRWPDSAVRQRRVEGSRPGRGFGVSGWWPSAAETPLPRLPRSSATDKWNVPRWPRPQGLETGGGSRVPPTSDIHVVQSTPPRSSAQMVPSGHTQWFGPS